MDITKKLLIVCEYQRKGKDSTLLEYSIYLTQVDVLQLTNGKSGYSLHRIAAIASHPRTAPFL